MSIPGTQRQRYNERTSCSEHEICSLLTWSWSKEIMRQYRNKSDLDSTKRDTHKDGKNCGGEPEGPVRRIGVDHRKEHVRETRQQRPEH